MPDEIFNHTKQYGIKFTWLSFPNTKHYRFDIFRRLQLQSFVGEENQTAKAGYSPHVLLPELCSTCMCDHFRAGAIGLNLQLAALDGQNRAILG